MTEAQKRLAYIAETARSVSRRLVDEHGRSESPEREDIAWLGRALADLADLLRPLADKDWL